jgi:hypothetical protein
MAVVTRVISMRVMGGKLPGARRRSRPNDCPRHRESPSGQKEMADGGYGTPEAGYARLIKGA